MPAVVLTLFAAAPLPSQLAAAPMLFVDSAPSAGITARISHGSADKAWIAEANGSGAAILDYDNDGWVDVLLLAGSTMKALQSHVGGGRAGAGGVYLYRNINGRRFEDVTSQAGLDCPLWGTGANAADYDNDGDVDILITAIGGILLYRNEGDGTFSEVGEDAGLGGARSWHTGSSFGDTDSDGDLDLFVAGYLELESLPIGGDAPVCDYRGLDVFCGPLELEAGTDALYRNNGDGTFTDVSGAAGIRGTPHRYAFTAVMEDFNHDNHLDIFVANDSAPNSLFLNVGDGSFSEDALAAGLAYNADGRQQADMGACMGDFDADGDLDMLTTTFSEDYFPLFAQQGPGIFEDVAFQAALQRETVRELGWACGFSDLDNDGDLDLWIANGHVYPNAGDLGSTSYHQSVKVFENSDGRFDPRPEATSGIPAGSYRGAASGDFDNDGRIDLLVLPIDGPPALLMNRTKNRHSWVGISLRPSGGNREGIGARVEIEHCGKRQFETLRNGEGYASRSDSRIHFGLGPCREIDAVTVAWPAGEKRVYRDLGTNRWHELGQDR